MSPLCREISGDGTKIQVDIYHGEDESGWILEVIDEENASTASDFSEGHNEALDPVYMKKLLGRGYQMALEGYPREKTPPGFILTN